MKFGIVGFGRFGQLWAHALLSFGDVLVYDKKTSDSSIKFTCLEEVAQADVVFVLVPISEFETSCMEIKRVLKPTSLVVDCCSVKIHPVKVMKRVFSPSQPLLATHPLFGPDSVKKSGGLMNHKIVICPLTPPQDEHEQLHSIFKKMGLIPLITTPDEHDEQMAHSQGLVHFLGRGLQALNLHQQELATPDFNALLNINGMVANDTWQLFFDMHHYNPYTREVRQKLISQLVNVNKYFE
ncbi:T-protein [Legionella steigerwaltii]|uniref:T-protein n=1 Tax=Legionella steigerwaltii TaxID=460 RepID=A0A378L779_9GAMM|nr:prephenate dehydrogenase/arogenate dehydrogenase family protein [Legionella steigerwaltii]KTD77471.1 T-protein [Legionella steigerwaltii]STY22673.1 T-protein [Legionella steigerwaltii]